MLILQESSSEPTASLIVYAPIDAISINMLFGDGDPDNVQLLPSGFTILPSGPPGCQGGIDDDSITNGTVLSIAFQILVDTDPYAKLSVASIATVNNLIESTAEKIKIALEVD
jgi:homeobox-leucine zipper protein